MHEHASKQGVYIYIMRYSVFVCVCVCVDRYIQLLNQWINEVQVRVSIGFMFPWIGFAK